MQQSQPPGHDWNAAYQRGETPWDKGTAAPPLMEFLERADIHGRVLVPGCGLGHDARAIAEAGAEHVLGVDIAEQALAAANALQNPASLYFELGDFLEADDSHRCAFDWVFEHTCISALHPDLLPAYAEAVTAALKPGGHYLAIFFLRPWDEGETPEPPPYGITEDEIDALFAGKLETVDGWTPSRHFPGREDREQMRVMKKPGG